ncbi:protoporphyrinogen oxidase [Pseudonocardia charpentierae]|uniref:Coproporphyrinogen III oxidase n=1 Tax=Pseudonocardia charpentierae TaxID=3075545 RepID=A0ABU2N989_9PSEU|nr:protoporphyrinogen oxidase [Pseudonocardia sp. DSM 45834]MDT0350510.1 protoporphyrinogen oxidase [Pseudonocardia sp. DSM 45834]
MSSPRVAVVGGGISGLTAAHRLRTLLGPAAEVVVLEQRDRVGGVLRTVDLAGVPYDVGAEAFLWRRPELRELLDDLGLAGEVVHPAGAAASVRAGGVTVPLPTGTLLGVPTSAARLDGVLSAAGTAAARAERDRPIDWAPGGDVALGGLLRDRFGDELADRLADPLLGGVYAGRVDALGLRATVPALAVALDAGASSVTAAADRATAPPPASPASVHASSASVHGELPVPAQPPVFGALRGGYAVLVDALATGVDVRLSTTVRALNRLADGWRLVLGPDQGALDVDAVVLAVPAPAVARLLADVVPTAATAAGEIELASSVVVALAYPEGDATRLPATSGVLVAAGEPVSIKAATHSSRKWPHLTASATDGLVRLRASVGRYGEEATLQVDDAELVARARADLATLAGITAAPVAVHVQRWGGGLPQYGVGHVDRVGAIDDAVACVPGLAVAGAALHGVGVPACVGTARAAAERVAEQLVAATAR